MVKNDVFLWEGHPLASIVSGSSIDIEGQGHPLRSKENIYIAATLDARQTILLSKSERCLY